MGGSQAMTPLRILHISDLHFASIPKLHNPPDFKFPSHGLEDMLVTRDRADTFLRTAEGLFKDNPPDAIIVSGDIVDRGGTDRPEVGPDEFGRARSFLKSLATRLNVEMSKVLVVPGNHDIDWSTQGDQRFVNYLEATTDFTSPHHLKGHVLTPVTVSLDNGQFQAEVTLLASPMQSGVRAPWDKALRQSVTDRLEDEVLAEDVEASNLADIAVLGTDQRDYLVSQRDRLPDGVKIAVLHHHLLPHPQIEFTAFETVVDGGATIDSLIEGGFALILSGHKHHRRLQRLAVPNSGAIDHYSAPSLFIHGPDDEPPGFTVIEIFGPDTPYYATFKYYDSNYTEPIRTENLRLDKRLVPAIIDVMGDLSEGDQKSVLPLLASFRDGTKLRDSLEHNGITKLFGDVLQRSQEDLSELAAGKWTLRPPKLAAQWEQFLASAQSWWVNSERPSVNLASVDDLDYWETAQVDEHSHAARYNRPITSLPGEKTRILILEDEAFTTDSEIAQADRIIRHMSNDGYRVVVVRANGARDKQYDFGIIGDIVVWTFNEIEGEIRGLSLFFDKRTIQKRKWQWGELTDRTRWDSTGSDGFLDWANRRREVTKRRDRDRAP